ncbi:MAG: ATP-binding cassette domain-containing protein [Acidimicrobiales bacterium]|nr:ATP-binding cassette domain-containing protein [Acidimicrobiales bacterium]MCB9371746.1 ATP-binding cassette domain-containing protein [Microthrixaceae bacterium]
MSPAPAVRLLGVAKSFGGPDTGVVPVLTGVDLTIERGEKVSLVGPSGSGKSTLLSLIAGLRNPDRGSVEVDGVALGGLGDAARARLRAERVGIALQADNLVPWLSARENVELALALGGSGRRSARARAAALLDELAVGHRAGHRPCQLSGGEVQRVALAVAVANGPRLVLADEVVGQLDGDTAGQVLDSVLAAPFALLLVTHDPVLADRADTRYSLVDHEVQRR